MSPGGQLHWWKCENCKCFFTYKNIDLHTEHCPSPKSEWSVDFIENLILHGTIQEAKSDEIRRILPQLSHERDFLFLSQSAMMLCEIRIGDMALVEISGYITVLKALPSTEGSLTRVGLVLEDLELRLGMKLNSNCIKVSKLLTKPTIAKTVHFHFEYPNEDYFSLESEVPKLSFVFMEKVVHKNMFLPMQYNIKTVKLKIDEIKSNEEFIIKNMEELSLNLNMFIIDCDTVWINNEPYKTPGVCACKENPIRIGGYSSLLNELTLHMSLVLDQNYIKDEVFSSYFFLLYGHRRTGKTYIAQHLGKISKKPFFDIFVDSDLLGDSPVETENNLKNMVQKIKSKAPCTVIMDNLELLFDLKENDRESRILSSTLSSLLDSIQYFPVVVIAISVDKDLLDPSFRRRLNDEFEINIPNQKDRFEVLSALVPKVKLSHVFEEISKHTDGFVAGDLAVLTDKAILKFFSGDSKIYKTGEIPDEYFLWALTQVKPSIRNKFQVYVPSVRWEDVGGGNEVRLELQIAVEWPILHAKSYSKMGIKPSKGVLLYGPPGCSKTLNAKALATEMKVNFMSVKISDIYSKWVGESEKVIRELFKAARDAAPSIIFLDEVDAIGANRDTSRGSVVYDKVLSDLLTEMDGVDSLNGVVLIAATNRPDCVDQALLRPGRFNKLIYVPLPDYAGRLQILQIRLGKIPTKDIDFAELAEKTDGYSGAEIVAACEEAVWRALHEDRKIKFVEMSHFISAFSHVLPRTPQYLLDIYEKFKNYQC